MVCNIFGLFWLLSANGRRIYQFICYKLNPKYYPVTIKFIFIILLPHKTFIHGIILGWVKGGWKKPVQGGMLCGKNPVGTSSGRLCIYYCLKHNTFCVDKENTNIILYTHQKSWKKPCVLLTFAWPVIPQTLKIEVQCGSYNTTICGHTFCCYSYSIVMYITWVTNITR